MRKATVGGCELEARSYTTGIPSLVCVQISVGVNLQVQLPWETEVLQLQCCSQLKSPSTCIAVCQLLLHLPKSVQVLNPLSPSSCQETINLFCSYSKSDWHPILPSCITPTMPSNPLYKRRKHVISHQLLRSPSGL